ncbi:uncharacterized protein ARMOST_22633 [Armillaria ostoyae]|uniref:Uncharacterized protein n=1 Tax=Armillaria ostoyae TaxID=47428 RepID=A0A284SDF5_ARMOS|nr:uncharacterized protein ARMOST_22633 [Armillaria ostoyae]
MMSRASPELEQEPHRRYGPDNSRLASCVFSEIELRRLRPDLTCMAKPIEYCGRSIPHGPQYTVRVVA